MANAEAELDGETDDAPAKAGRRGLLAGAAGALVLGVGAFYAVWSGMILAPPETGAAPSEAAAAPHAEVAFVSIEPLTVSLGPGAGATHLRFRANLEVAPGGEYEVERLMPRVVDVLNGYLRAVEPAELTAPGAMIRLRAQMLRRVRMVAGPDVVRDLLIMEFVLT